MQISQAIGLFLFHGYFESCIRESFYCMLERLELNLWFIPSRFYLWSKFLRLRKTEAPSLPVQQSSLIIKSVILWVFTTTWFFNSPPTYPVPPEILITHAKISIFIYKPKFLIFLIPFMAPFSFPQGALYHLLRVPQNSDFSL